MKYLVVVSIAALACFSCAQKGKKGAWTDAEKAESKKNCVSDAKKGKDLAGIKDADLEKACECMVKKFEVAFAPDDKELKDMLAPDNKDPKVAEKMMQIGVIECILPLMGGPGGGNPPAGGTGTENPAGGGAGGDKPAGH